ncbi:MAG TPA: hypothetical protein VK845_02170 [Gemmatimonadales bacterium]|nr:hypothetical protein [Gemmatimonadales bacterium]
MIVVLLLLLAVPAGTAAAQALDQGTLSIRQDGREVGREQFVLRQGRGRGDGPGTTLTSTARFRSGDSVRTFVAVLQRTPAGSIAAFQYDLPPTSATRRILAATDGGRLTVRSLGEDMEAARQWPATPSMVLLTDSVFVLYAAIADLATPGGSSLTAVFPRTGVRIGFTATRLPGSRPTETTVQLSGGLTGTVTLDAAGHLERLDLPNGISVVRRPD